MTWVVNEKLMESNAINNKKCGRNCRGVTLVDEYNERIKKEGQKDELILQEAVPVNAHLWIFTWRPTENPLQGFLLRIFGTAGLYVPHPKCDPTTSNNHDIVLGVSIFQIDNGLIQTNIL